MRVAASCWPMVVGLPVFVGQTLLAVVPTHGWEQNALRANPAQPPAGTDVRVVGTISDDMVQPAGHTSVARQTPNRNAAGNATRPKVGMFHGMELRLPKMPFGRGGDAKSAQRNQSQAIRADNGQTPMATPRTASRFGASQPSQSSERSVVRAVAGSSMPAHAMPRPASAAPSRESNIHARARQPHQAIAQGRTTVAPLGQSTIAASHHSPTIANEPRPFAAAPDASTPMEAASAAGPSQPQSAADRLMMQAHALSSGAQTVDDYTRIVETCRRCRASQPSQPVDRYASELAGWALNRRGQLKADAGQLREAMLDFDDAIRADASCWRAIHNRGVLLAQSGQFEKAFDDFNRTIQVNAEFAKAYSNRAALFVVAGDLLPALADYQRAIELDPNLSVAHRGRGRVCHLLGRLDEATGHYDAAVQLAPDDAYAISSRADLLTDLGRYTDAVRDYQRSIELDSRSPDAYRGLAWLMATCPDDSVRDPARAMELAEFALTLDERQESIGLDTLAAAQASAGDFSAAMQTLHKAIKSAPEAERTVYQDRLVMYQHAKPFRIAPVRPVTQASFQSH